MMVLHFDGELTLLLLSLAAVCILNLPLLAVMPVRCEVLGKKSSIAMFLVAILLGFYVSGNKVMTTVSSEIAKIDSTGFLMASALTFLIMITLSLRDIPASVQQVMVMCIAGIAVGSCAAINTGKIVEIVLSWIGSILLSASISLLLYPRLRSVFNSLTPLKREAGMRVFMILVLFLLSMASGSSTVATAVSPLSIVTDSKAVLAGVVMVFAFFGVIARYWLFHAIPPRLLDNLDVSAVALVQMSAALSVFLFSLVGMPVSINHAVFASLFVVSYLKDIRILERKVIRNFVRNGLGVPLLSFIAGAVVSAIM